MILFDEDTGKVIAINAGQNIRGIRFTHILLDVPAFRDLMGHLMKNQNSVYLNDILSGFRPYKQESPNAN